MQRRSVSATAFAALVGLMIGFIQVFSLTTWTNYQRVLVDLGHVPVFAVISIAVLALLRTRRKRPSDSFGANEYVLATIVVLGLAIGSEALQILDPARSASIADVLRNGAGGALGLLSCRLYGYPEASRERPLNRPKLKGVAGGLIIALLAAPAWMAAAYAHKVSAWPTVVGGSYRLERAFAVAYQSQIDISPVPPESRTKGDERAFRVTMRDCDDCGILFAELGRNWESFTDVCVDITNPASEPLRISVRLGNKLMFFRSSAFYTSALPVPAKTRVTRCLPLSGFEDAEGSKSPRNGYGSMALLTSGAQDARIFFLHRLWLQ